jgi:gliding motility-associated-like protein
MKHIIYITILLLISSVDYGIAQTINTGQMTIRPGTEISILDDFDNTASASLINNGTVSIHQDFNNNGVISFLLADASGLTQFIGNTLQQITGSSISTFYNLTFDNLSGDVPFQLSGGMYTLHTVDFSNGIIQNDGLNGAFIFGQNATHINTSDVSFVDGEVEKIGDTAFEFPTGDDLSYRKIQISAPDDQGDNFTAKYYKENSHPTYSHDLTAGVIELIDTHEYWTLTRKQGNSDVVITLTWDDTTTAPEILAGSRSAIHIVRWDAVNGFWVDEGGIVDESNQTVTTVTTVSGYGVFALARVKEDLILPGGIVVYNLITPNGDGDNDFLRIDGLNLVGTNTVEIFNRWGTKVFETSNYNNTDNSFKGFSDGRATFNRGEQLPTGTYYYILNYDYNAQRIKKAGYLYINGKK